VLGVRSRWTHTVDTCGAGWEHRARDFLAAPIALLPSGVPRRRVPALSRSPAGAASHPGPQPLSIFVYKGSGHGQDRAVRGLDAPPTRKPNWDVYSKHVDWTITWPVTLQKRVDPRASASRRCTSPAAVAAWSARIRRCRVRGRSSYPPSRRGVRTAPPYASDRVGGPRGDELVGHRSHRWHVIGDLRLPVDLGRRTRLQERRRKCS